MGKHPREFVEETVLWKMLGVSKVALGLMSWIRGVSLFVFFFHKSLVFVTAV